ncbi:MAG: polyisoprenoid-binding protein [Candidatus Omnitrophica bacterium]|nr:polyisoprenoid-binding protein [Candidatus Omnitrophota bacterium]
MKIFYAMVVAVVLVCSGVAAQAAPVYTPDKVHSSIDFLITHMMVARVSGAFTDYDGAIEFDPKEPASMKVDFTVKVAGIDTKNEARDHHLRSADFFDAEKYPTITFKSKKVVATGNGQYAVTGDLTMKAVTKEITIPATLLGPVNNPMGGGQMIGVETHFTVNRQDYGVSWNKALDNGGIMVGNDVDVRVNLEAHSK